MPALNQTLNLDSIDTVDARRPRTVVQSAPKSATTDASPLFPAAPVYARKPAKKASNNMALLVGAPVVLVAAGAIAWAMMGNSSPAPAPAETSSQIAVTDTAPLAPPLAPAAMPAPVPAPFETAAVETAAPRAATQAPVRAAPRATVARRAAPAQAQATAPDASSASSNVSATVPAPAAAIVADPTPVVIAAPAAAAPTPAPTPVTPVDPQ